MRPAALLDLYRQYAHSPAGRSGHLPPSAGRCDLSTNSSPAPQPRGCVELAANGSHETAPIDIEAFGKRLGEIITKAMLGLPGRRRR